MPVAAAVAVRKDIVKPIREAIRRVWPLNIAKAGNSAVENPG